MIFPAYASNFAGGPLFANGMISGCLVAIVMTLCVRLTEFRPSRIAAELDSAAMLKVRECLRTFAARNGWDAEMENRLDAVGEEALLTLVQLQEGNENHNQRRCFRLTASRSELGAGTGVRGRSEKQQHPGKARIAWRSRR